jgi:hypothetical protein
VQSEIKITVAYGATLRRLALEFDRRCHSERVPLAVFQSTIVLQEGWAEGKVVST